MTFLVTLFVWIVVIGLVVGLLSYAVRAFPIIPEPFKGAAIAVLCVAGVLVLLGALLNGWTFPGLAGPARSPFR